MYNSLKIIAFSFGTIGFVAISSMVFAVEPSKNQTETAKVEPISDAKPIINWEKPQQKYNSAKEQPPAKPVKKITLADYNSQKALILADFNRCDLINAQEIINQTSQPVNRMYTEQEGLQKIFTATAIARESCYNKSGKSLNGLYKKVLNYIKNNKSTKNKNNDENLNETIQQLKLKLASDKGLIGILAFRKNISLDLLRSNFEDIQLALLTYQPPQAIDTNAEIKNCPTNKENQKAQKSQKPKDCLLPQNAPEKSTQEAIFVEESPHTIQLIARETALINEIDRRELFMQEMALPASADSFEIMPLKAQFAHHYFTKAMVGFDYLTQQRSSKKPNRYQLTTKQIDAETAYGAAHLRQVIALARAVSLKEIAPHIFKDMLRIDRKIRMITLSMSNIPDEKEASIILSDGYDSWAQELYQKISELTSETNVLQARLVALREDIRQNKQAEEMAKAREIETLVGNKAQ